MNIADEVKYVREIGIPHMKETVGETPRMMTKKPLKIIKMEFPSIEETETKIREMLSNNKNNKNNKKTMKTTNITDNRIQDMEFTLDREEAGYLAFALFAQCESPDAVVADIKKSKDLSYIANHMCAVNWIGNTFRDSNPTKAEEWFKAYRKLQAWAFYDETYKNFTEEASRHLYRVLD